ncbi:MAG: metalloregulator ArsR/SmtB family transcription factor [Caldilineaceae bacterium]
MSDSSSYRAIADTNRRFILDLLRAEGPLRAGELVARLAHISQPAVSKHLRILREANLVRAEKAGREQLYHLNPAALRQVAAWLAHYEPLWDQRLATLKTLVETEAMQPSALSQAPQNTQENTEEELHECCDNSQRD